MVRLTDGTTSPPTPNMPISGRIADLRIRDGGNLITIGALDLVDNAFAVPAATGCGHPAGRLDAAIDAGQGLPSPAGNDTLILNGSSALAVPTRSSPARSSQIGRKWAAIGAGVRTRGR